METPCADIGRFYGGFGQSEPCLIAYRRREFRASASSKLLINQGSAKMTNSSEAALTRLHASPIFPR
jgi:hypothetical protein